MELVSPAGDLFKLRLAWAYGADAAYMGWGDFSLRRQIKTADEYSIGDLSSIKKSKKLYLAINSVFTQSLMTEFAARLDELSEVPCDAFIVSDAGAARLLKNRYPDVSLHLSTQANCLNAETAKFWRDQGFSRIVLGREATLDDIAEIHHQVPEVAIEAFAHGAMCWAYSGRCYLSAAVAGPDRSANLGDCTHSCRWDYRLWLEESRRPGQFIAIEDSSGQHGYTALLSSADLCMLEYLDKMKQAGVSAIKIEGRQKSSYYVSLATQIYRKGLDALLAGTTLERRWVEELDNLPHREYSQGFYFGTTGESKMNQGIESHSNRAIELIGFVGKEIQPQRREFFPKGSWRKGDEVEVLGPEIEPTVARHVSIGQIESGEFLEEVHPGAKFRTYWIESDVPLRENYYVRKRRIDGQ